MQITIHPTLLFSWMIAGPGLIKMMVLYILGTSVFIAVCMFLGGEVKGVPSLILATILCFMVFVAVVFAVAFLLLPNIILSPS